MMSELVLVILFAVAGYAARLESCYYCGLIEFTEGQNSNNQKIQIVIRNMTESINKGPVCVGEGPEFDTTTVPCATQCAYLTTTSSFKVQGITLEFDLTSRFCTGPDNVDKWETCVDDSQTYKNWMLDMVNSYNGVDFTSESEACYCNDRDYCNSAGIQVISIAVIVAALIFNCFLVSWW